MTKRNARPLEAIAADIHKHDRQSVFTIGKLLIEAKESCEHGHWRPWIDQFGFSKSSTAYYMEAARLTGKCPTVGHLKLAMRTINRLTQLPDNVVPLAVKALQKVAIKKQLSVAEGNQIIDRVDRKQRFGDWPDHVLAALDRLTDCSGTYHGDEWKKIQTALRKDRPETEGDAFRIIHGVLLPECKPDSDADEAATTGDESEEPSEEYFESPPTAPDDDAVAELDDALSVVLTFASRAERPKVSTLGISELIQIRSFLNKWFEEMQAQSRAKAVADRARVSLR